MLSTFHTPHPSLLTPQASPLRLHPSGLTPQPSLTIEAIECPVAAYVQWTGGELEDEGSGVVGQVGVTGCDVDAIRVWLLTHFHLRGRNTRGVVINVQQHYLKGPRPAGWWDTWEQKHLQTMKHCMEELWLSVKR